MRRLWIVLACLALVSVAAAGGAAAQGYVVVLNRGANPGAVAADHAQRLGVDVGFVYRHALKGYSAAVPAGGLGEVTGDHQAGSRQSRT